jgi:hypothetical protein
MRKIFPLWILGILASLLISLLMFSSFGVFIPAGAASRAPTYADMIPNDTHFLVTLDDELSTVKDKVNKKFNARTIEPLQTSHGFVLAPGARIYGHVSRIESGSITGRARLWLTFDDIDTPNGRLPIVAEVSSVPGDFSVRRGESREGEIEARTSKGTQDIEAAATGAALGAAAGAAKGGGKGAAIGAAAGGVAAFMASSGIGQELDLQKGTKLDLVLDRPLLLARR